ncbi:MAG: RHS repeat protein [Acidobacteria bacterium]|nr:RHS repeat protein [Acidobacteriota bacterium]
MPAPLTENRDPPVSTFPGLPPFAPHKNPCNGGMGAGKLPPGGPLATIAPGPTPTGGNTPFETICPPPRAPSLPINTPSGGESIIESDIADPVYLHSGEFRLTEVDLAIPGRGFPYQFIRTYRSQVFYDGPLGFNWAHSYDKRLFLGDPAANGILFHDGFARADQYVRKSDGTYDGPTGFYTKLIRNADGTYMLRARDGMLYTFNQLDGSTLEGRLASMTDRNGNTMRFEYDSRGRLATVTDTLSRDITYVYDDNSNRLLRVTDFAGRVIRFRYDRNFDVIEVTSPVVTGTPNGNNFSNGKSTRYTYSSGFRSDRLDHNLLTITRPNDVASGGPPSVVNTYGTTSGTYEEDRVIQQLWGGTNSGGVAAGGTVTLQYERLNPGADVNNLTIPRNRTTVTDRNGNRLIFEHNSNGNRLSMKVFTNRDINPNDPEFFETRYEYNRDGELLRVIYPEGNSVEYVYDASNADRFQKGNLLEIRRIAGPRGGDTADPNPDPIVTSFTYEPVYNQVQTITEARGSDPNYVPQNGGANSPDRYRTARIFDYQEGTAIRAYAQRFGINLGDIPMGLGDLNGDGRTSDIAGNIVEVRQPAVTLLADSRQATIEGDVSQEIVWTYTYNQFGQMTSEADPEGNLDIYLYHPENDPDGDGRDIIRAPGLSTVTFGYLRENIRDFDPAKLNSLPVPISNSGIMRRRAGVPFAETGCACPGLAKRYLYDRVGNVIQTTDGRNNITRYIVNQLNQVVRTISEPPFSYERDYFYDFNNNLVRVDIQNVVPDGAGGNRVVAENPKITQTFAYDILDNLVEKTEEVSDGEPGIGPAERITTRYRYDKNENLVLLISPEAVAGRQPNNVRSRVYDERNLAFSETRGGVTDQFRALPAHAGMNLANITNSPGVSTTTRIYDGNRNLVLIVDAEDNNGDGRGDETIYAYDGFDRLIRVLDAAGNRTERTYDPASNLTSESRFGPTGGPSPRDNRGANNVLLARTLFKYDELGRRFQVDRALFDTGGSSVQDGPLTPNDGLVTTRTEYDRNSRKTRTLDDNIHQTLLEYDGADRLVRRTDELSSRVEYAYDGNNNIIRKTEIEFNPDNVNTGTPQSRVVDGRPAEVFVTFNVYDELDRLTRMTDNLGQTRRSAYDSRDNLMIKSDANGPLMADPLNLFSGQINGPGNTTSFVYDGLNRLLRKVVDLRVGGQGNGSIDMSNPTNPDGRITVGQAWDANSRLTAQTDDNGNTTRYQYDDLNRGQRIVFGDDTMKVFAYDRDDHVIRLVDNNGSAIDNAYDAIDRLLRRDVTRAGGVQGTTLQAFEYDGLRRLVRATDNNDPADAADDVTVRYQYDSLSRVLVEDQNGRLVRSRLDGVGNKLSLTYPNGRQIETTFDGLDRIDQIRNPQSAIPSPLVDYNYIGPGRVLSRTYSNGVSLARTYDAVKRIVKHEHLLANPQQLVAGFEYDYDREENRRFEIRAHDTGRGDVFGYDSAYRVIDYKREVMNPRAEANQPGTGGPVSARTQYRIDGANNWRSVDFGQMMGTFVPNVMNEYDMVGGMRQAHDENGNLLDDGQRRFVYDVFNRLIRVENKMNGTVIAVYSYDAHNRRVMKQTNAGTMLFFYDEWRDIEEQDGGGRIVAQYVNGRELDEVVTMDRDVRGDGRLATFFYHDNAAVMSAAVLTDSQGRVVERYSYDLYGEPIVTAASGAKGIESTVGNPFFYQSRRLDAETGFYYYRYRYYDPQTGRFLQRDPMGIWHDQGNLGNGYAYVFNKPVNFVDPYGLTGLNPTPEVSNNSPTPPRVVIGEVEGDADVKRGDGKFETAEEGMVLGPGDTIYTGYGSKVVVRVDECLIWNIPEVSTAKIIEITATEITTQQEPGVADVGLKQLPVFGSDFQTSTPRLDIAVRG